MAREQVGKEFTEHLLGTRTETVNRSKGKNNFFSPAQKTTTTTIATTNPTPHFQGLKESFSFSPFYKQATDAVITR